MKIRPSQLWTVNGEIGRGEYVIWGGVLFALKGYLDRYLFRDVLQANWDWLDYLRWNFPSPSLVSPEALSAQGWPLLLAALPFWARAWG